MIRDWPFPLLWICPLFIGIKGNGHIAPSGRRTASTSRDKSRYSSEIDVSCPTIHPHRLPDNGWQPFVAESSERVYFFFIICWAPGKLFRILSENSSLQENEPGKIAFFGNWNRSERNVLNYKLFLTSIIYS